VGHGRFVAFYLLCGLAAALAQTYTNGGSTVPMVGASGAVAGVMGAYFVLYPRSRIVTLVPIVIFIQIIEIPAIFFLGIWFLMQFVSGVGSLATAGQSIGGIAF
jgi:membrane associated rhomboid family serine protease